MINQNLIPESGFLRIQTILQIFPIGKSTWWAGCRTGRFPKPIKIGKRTTVWKAEDIKSLVESYNTSNSSTQKGGENGR